MQEQQVLTFEKPVTVRHLARQIQIVAKCTSMVDLHEVALSRRSVPMSRTALLLQVLCGHGWLRGPGSVAWQTEPPFTAPVGKVLEYHGVRHAFPLEDQPKKPVEIRGGHPQCLARLPVHSHVTSELIQALAQACPFRLRPPPDFVHVCHELALHGVDALRQTINEPHKLVAKLLCFQPERREIGPCQLRGIDLLGVIFANGFHDSSVVGQQLVRLLLETLLHVHELLGDACLKVLDTAFDRIEVAQGLYSLLLQVTDVHTRLVQPFLQLGQWLDELCKLLQVELYLRDEPVVGEKLLHDIFAVPLQLPDVLHKLALGLHDVPDIVVQAFHEPRCGLNLLLLEPVDFLPEARGLPVNLRQRRMHLLQPVVPLSGQETQVQQGLECALLELERLLLVGVERVRQHVRELFLPIHHLAQLLRHRHGAFVALHLRAKAVELELVAPYLFQRGSQNPGDHLAEPCFHLRRDHFRLFDFSRGPRRAAEAAEVVLGVR
mmetsp:Transcript_70171/g.195255  ORF Transcript_70171/g.195255 Transcript_70171/m.195255 type:complete len:492 (-) Transcript_70171:67-1542(-)